MNIFLNFTERYVKWKRERGGRAGVRERERENVKIDPVSSYFFLVRFE